MLKYEYDERDFKNWVEDLGRQPTPDEFVQRYGKNERSEREQQSRLTGDIKPFAGEDDIFGKGDDKFWWGGGSKPSDDALADRQTASQTLDAYQTAKGLGFMGLNNQPQQQGFGSVGSAIGQAGTMAANTGKQVSQGIRKIFERDDLDQLYAQALADKKERENQALIQLAADNRALAALVGAEPPPTPPIPDYNLTNPSQAADWANFKIF